MKKLSTIIGISLILCGIGYLLFGKKIENNEDENNSDNSTTTNDEIIKKTIQTLIDTEDYDNPGDLVVKSVREVMNIKNDFSILEYVPKNIEELEEYLKKEGLYEKYEKSISKKYKLSK